MEKQTKVKVDDLPKYTKVNLSNTDMLRKKIFKITSSTSTIDTIKAQVSFLLTFRNRYWTVVTLGRTSADIFVNKLNQVFMGYTVAQHNRF